MFLKQTDKNFIKLIISEYTSIIDTFTTLVAPKRTFFVHKYKLTFLAVKQQ